MMTNIRLLLLFILLFILPNIILTEKCPENEYYDTCGSNCPLTCENPKPQMCTKMCVIGCYCNNGLIRDTEINECVPIEECPGVEIGPCKEENEEFKECGPVCFETCSDPERNCPGCKKGCFCKEGYVRDDFINYECVPKQSCNTSTPISNTVC